MRVKMKTNIIFLMIIIITFSSNRNILAAKLSQTQLNFNSVTENFERGIYSILNDELGFQYFQNYLNGRSDYTVSVEPTPSITELEANISGVLMQARDSAVSLSNAVTTASNSSVINIIACSSSAIELTPTVNYNQSVDFSVPCFSGPQLSNFEIASSINSIFINSSLSYSSIRSQYYTLETGVTVTYPAQRITQSYDGRLSSWYSIGVFSKSRDVVILLDNDLIRSNRAALLATIDIIMQSLTPQDRVGIVNLIDIVSPLQICMELSSLSTLPTLFAATPNNIQQFSQSLAALTATPLIAPNYEQGFKSAFSQFGTVSNNTNSRVILFFSSSQINNNNSQQVSTLLSTISTENGKLENSVTIFSLAYDAVRMQVLQDISQQTMYNTSFAPPTKGNYIQIMGNGVASTIRSSLTPLYNYFANLQTNQVVSYTRPYYKEFYGAVVSAVQAIISNGEFLGVAAVDLLLDDLLPIIFRQYSEYNPTYAFIVSASSGLLYVHPNLNIPNSAENMTSNLLELKNAEGSNAGLITNILRNDNYISTPIMVTQTFLVGNIPEKGVNSKSMEVVYTSKRILDSDLRVCIVASTQHTLPLIALTSTSNRLTGRGVYHLNFTASCSFNQVPSTFTSSFKIAPRGFLDPTEYLFSEEQNNVLTIPNTVDARTINYLDDKLPECCIIGTSAALWRFPQFGGLQSTICIGKSMNHWLGNITNSPLKNGVLEHLHLSSQLAEWWTNNTDVNLRIRFIGTTKGIYRTYPGVALSSAYDPTLQPWYRNAVAHSNITTLTGPLLSPFFVLSTVSISRTVYLSNSQLFGVIGTTFPINYMFSMLKSQVSSCSGNNQCFLIDLYGNVIINTRDDILSNLNMNHHISYVVPQITNILFTNKFLDLSMCIDLDRKLQITYYKLNTNRLQQLNGYSYSVDNFMFNLTIVNSLDLYLLIIPSDSMETTGERISQSSMLATCRLINNEDLSYVALTLPICPTIDTPYLSQYTSSQPMCYDNVCNKYGSEEECSSNFCVWCTNFQGKSVGCPRCVISQECPNGEIPNFNNCMPFSLGGIVALVLMAVVLIIVLVAILAYCIKSKKYQRLVQGIQAPVQSTHTKDTSVATTEHYNTVPRSSGGRLQSRTVIDSTNPIDEKNVPTFLEKRNS